MGVEFKKLTTEESAKLRTAILDNAQRGKAIKMDVLTTGWSPGDDEESAEEQLINAIHSVPCHYVSAS